MQGPLIPIPPGDKGTKTNGWSEPRYRGGLIPGGWNVGRRLDGVTVVDCDSPEAVAWWEANGQATSLVSESRPGHRAYWYEGEVAVGTYHWYLPDGTRAGEVRTGRRHYCVVPPSVHPSGSKYQWLLDSPSPANQGPLVDEFLLPPRRGGTTAVGDFETADWGERLPNETCPVHSDRKPSLGMQVRDGVIYANCYSGCDFWEVVEALVAEGRYERAELWPPVPEPGVFEPPPGLVRAEDGTFRVASEATIVVPAVPTARGLEEWNGADLSRADLPPIETLPLLGVPGYIGKGFSNLISADPKAGKTTLMLSLLTEWLGLGLSVLYFTEEPRELWHPRLEAPPERWAGLQLVMAQGEPVAELLERMIARPVDVVIVDTLRSVVQVEDENDNSMVSRAIIPWINAARGLGATFVALHHKRKTDGSHGKGISGGHALLGQFDQSLELDRGNGCERTIRAMGRIGSQPDLPYEMIAGGLVARAPSLDLLDAETIKQWMGERDDVPGRDEMAAALGLSKHRVEAARATLARQGHLSGAGKSLRWDREPAHRDTQPAPSL